MLAQTADSTTRSNEIAFERQKKVSQGHGVVSDMRGAIGQIDQSNQTIMTEIERSNPKISEIDKLIGDIGENT